MDPIYYKGYKAEFILGPDVPPPTQRANLFFDFKGNDKFPNVPPIDIHAISNAQRERLKVLPLAYSAKRNCLHVKKEPWHDDSVLVGAVVYDRVFSARYASVPYVVSDKLIIWNTWLNNERAALKLFAPCGRALTHAGGWERSRTYLRGDIKTVAERCLRFAHEWELGTSENE